MANETIIYPYGQGATIPSGYPISTSLDENNSQKAAAASLTYQLKRMIGSAGGGADFAQVIAARARQMANIEWTPKNDVYINGVEKSADTTLKGLPYSSVKEIDKYIGYDVSIYTFMTAVNNPYSLLYTERVGPYAAKSGIGKTYNGVNCDLYMGVVCNVFAQYCNMAPVAYNTGEHAWMANNKSNFSFVTDYNESGAAQKVKVGDIVWSTGHDRCITDVVKDKDGVVTQVTITESKPATISLTALTAADFETYLNGSNPLNAKCKVYRYSGLSPIYIPIPFVAAAGECPETIEYNNDICTIAGDKACFKTDDVIRINYNLKADGGWTKMYVYKLVDGAWAQVKESNLPNMSDNTDLHYIDLTSDNLQAGMYKARLFDGTKYSDYTYFEVIGGSVTQADQGSGITRIGFSSANGKAIYFEVCSDKGETKAIDGLTDLDRQRGYVDVNFEALRSAQGYGSSWPATSFIKVHFEGQYGRVAYKIAK